MSNDSDTSYLQNMKDFHSGDKVLLYVHWCKGGLIFILTILKCTWYLYLTAGQVATCEMDQLPLLFFRYFIFTVSLKNFILHENIEYEGGEIR